MQKQSNNIHELGNNIWNSWADESGSIGKAYGYQVSKPITVDGKTYKSQVHYVLERLSNDSSDRRAVIDLWNVDDLGEMNLSPCCYSSIWTITDGKLNCMLVQRSADFLVGVPFNTTQYAILTHLFARHLNVEPGQLTHVMADAHIYCYDSHLNGAIKMVNNYRNIGFISTMITDYPGLLEAYEVNFKNDPENAFKLLLSGLLTVDRCTLDRITNDADYMYNLIHVAKSSPKLLINSSETDFFSISASDIIVDDYSYVEKIKFDVAV